MSNLYENDQIQETKWTGKNAKELDNSGFKHWYTCKAKSRNGMRNIVDNDGKKYVVKQDTFNVTSPFAHLDKTS